MGNDTYLDLNYVPRYHSSSRKQFAPGERHVTRFGTQNVLLLVMDGVLCFEENGEQISLKKGEYYVQVAGKHQRGDQPSELPEYVFINFTGRFTAKKSRDLPLRGQFDIERIETLYQRLKNCERMLKQKEDLRLLFDRQVIFFDILNTLHKKNVGLAQRQTVAGEIYEYLNLHFSQDITLEDLSKRFGYSKDHIIRIFKSTYMITPYQHLSYCRICHAKLLLSTEQMTVREVAAACGYGDYTSFYHAFVHAQGMTPTEYRLQNREFHDTGEGEHGDIMSVDKENTP